MSLNTELVDPVERAAACNQIADWYLQMDDECNSMRYRRLCWDAYPEFYENISPLILGELKSNNIDSAIDYSEQFFVLAPKNQTVMQDLLEIYEDKQYWGHFEKLIVKLKRRYVNDNEALGNISFHFAMYLEYSGKKKESIEHLKTAKKLFIKVDKKHYILRQIDNVLGNKT